MKRLTGILVLVIMGVVGAVAGAMTAPPAQALYGYGLYVNPGASRDALTCGFHGTCDTENNNVTSGNALDWGSYSTNNVYWRSWATADSGSGTMAYAFPYDSTTATCYGAAANVYGLGWAWRGVVVYLHTTSTSTSGIYINGSWGGAYTSAGPIGTTRGSEKTDECPWDNPHLHQYSTADGGWYSNTNVYPVAPNTGQGWTLSDFANWQNRVSWVE